MKTKIIEALKKCAKAHKVECNVYDEDPHDTQVAIMGLNIPLEADVRMIVEAFYGHSNIIVSPDQSWGYINVLLDYFPMLPKPDMEMVKLALPSRKRW